MNTHTDKTRENESQPVSNAVSQNKSSSGSVFQFVDNRAEAIEQKNLQEIMNKSSQTMQLSAFQEMANNSPGAMQAAQLQALADNYTAQQKQPVQKKENKTGLPDNLKAGIENLSGYAMDDVKVHYNSDKPAQLQAHAYAQGTEIHVAPGQEQHLPHEAWHVVQQKQGRVQPTMQLKGKVDINDDAGLEKEADVMGANALAGDSLENSKDVVIQSKTAARHAAGCSGSAGVVQPKILLNGLWYGKGDEARANAAKTDQTPAWTTAQLESEDPYTLNEDQTAWVKDTQLNFMKFKNNTKTGGAKTGASGPSPLNDVGFGGQNADRIGPKHPETRTVSKMQLYKYSSEREGHWMLQCDVEGGKTGKKPMKIDLMSTSYRIMYGASQPPTKISSQFDFELQAPAPVQTVYDVFVQIAKEKGEWTGTDKYNCQDFALAMLSELKVKQEDQLQQEAQWREEHR